MTNPINEYAQNEIDILSVSPEVEHLCPRILRVVAALRRLVRKEDPVIATCDGTSSAFLAARGNAKFFDTAPRRSTSSLLGFPARRRSRKDGLHQARLEL